MSINRDVAFVWRPLDATPRPWPAEIFNTDQGATVPSLAFTERLKQEHVSDGWPRRALTRVCGAVVAECQYEEVDRRDTKVWDGASVWHDILDFTTGKKASIRRWVSGRQAAVYLAKGWAFSSWTLG